MDAHPIDQMLDPKRLRSVLIRTSLFLTTYEILKSEIETHLKDFLDFASKESEFKKTVLPLAKYQFEACLLWYKEAGAISDQQILEIHEIRKHRNELAHRIPEILLSLSDRVDPEMLDRCHKYIRVFSLFWARINIDCNPDFDGQEIADEDIGSSLVSLVTYLREITDETAI